MICNSNGRAHTHAHTHTIKTKIEDISRVHCYSSICRTKNVHQTLIKNHFESLTLYSIFFFNFFFCFLKTLTQRCYVYDPKRINFVRKLFKTLCLNKNTHRQDKIWYCLLYALDFLVIFQSFFFHLLLLLLSFVPNKYYLKCRAEKY